MKLLFNSIEAILANLNPEQLKAVQHTQGPQLIVAGAGTGKTTVITKRIAYLVANKICSAHQILALTFTEKAAAEMEKRVDVLVPYGFTDSTICTFHALGDKILREQGILLGINPDYRVLSSAEQIIFFREHLFELPLNKLRPLADPTRHIKAILNIISRAKDELVTPDKYLEKCLEKMNSNNQIADSAMEAFWEKQIEISHIYKKYEALLLENGLIDFGDLIIKTLDILKTCPDVLADYQKKFTQILVDEFQDTNSAQFELIRLLAGDNPQLSVVGDDDQSIYKFRGAAITNIMMFMEYYPNAIIHVLNQNYRSTQTILDAAYRLIQNNNPDRLEYKIGFKKQLISQSSDKLPVIFQQFETVSAEADWIATKLQMLNKTRSLKWNDFAILVRTNRQADPYIRALNLQNIPFHFSGQQDFYQQPEIRLCVAFLRLMADPHNSLAMHELIASRIYNMLPEDIAQLFAVSNKTNRSVFTMLEQNADMENEILTSTSKIIGNKIIEDLKKNMNLSQQLNTGQLLYRFISESGLLSQLTQTSSIETDQAIKNIAKFFRIVQNYQDLSKINRVIHFIKHLNMLENIDETVSNEAIDPDLDAIHILTVHRAKGLEFPVVFMAGLGTNRFPTINRASALFLPNEFIKTDTDTADPHLSEERRLFYVGLTRAKNQLFLTHAKDYGGKRLYKVSRFVLESLELTTELEAHSISLTALEQIQTHAYIQKQKPLRQSLRQPGNIQLSFYQIDDYITCPLKYKFIHILKIPILPHHSIHYGKALHTAIDEYYKMKKSCNPIEIDRVVNVFLNTWVNQGFISREHEELRQKTGIQALIRFVQTEEKTNIIPKYIEKGFSFMLADSKISGRMDRVDELEGGKIRIVDFKSSEVINEKEADKKTKESMQLKIYALAWLKSKNKLPDCLSLYFIESGIIGNYSPTLEQINEVEKKIIEVGEEIREQNFKATANVWICNYCPYRSICPDVES